MRRHSLLAVLAFSSCVTLFSCSDSIAPRAVAKPKPIGDGATKPTADMQALPPMEVDLSAAPGTVTVGSIPFVEGVIADISITGLISLQSEDVAWPIHYSGTLDPAGVGVPNGTCHLWARLSFFEDCCWIASFESAMSNSSYDGGLFDPRAYWWGHHRDAGPTPTDEQLL